MYSWRDGYSPSLGFKKPSFSSSALSLCGGFALVSPGGFAGKQMYSYTKNKPWLYKVNDFSTGKLGTS